MTEQELVEIAKVILPAGAIIISVISLVKTNRNTKRQIRVAKIENIIECLRMFMSNYSLLHLIYQRQHLYKNSPPNSEKYQIEDLKADYLKAVEVFNKNSDVEILRENGPRLAMLANSYLPEKELKMKIMSLVGLMTSLIECTIFENYEETRKLFPKYPGILDFFKYIEQIEIELIQEMNLGYKGVKFEDLMAYKNKFLNDLKISDIPAP